MLKYSVELWSYLTSKGLVEPFDFLFEKEVVYSWVNGGQRGLKSEVLCVISGTTVTGN